LLSLCIRKGTTEVEAWKLVPKMGAL
jgi:hypothetical protein